MVKRGEYYLTKTSYKDIKKNELVKISFDHGNIITVKRLCDGSKELFYPSELDGPCFKCRACKEYAKGVLRYRLCDKCIKEYGLSELLN